MTDSTPLCFAIRVEPRPGQASPVALVRDSTRRTRGSSVAFNAMHLGWARTCGPGWDVVFQSATRRWLVM